MSREDYTEALRRVRRTKWIGPHHQGEEAKEAAKRAQEEAARPSEEKGKGER